MSVWPWAHHNDGQSHWAACRACGEQIVAWRGPAATGPSESQHRKIHAHLGSHGVAS